MGYRSVAAVLSLVISLVPTTCIAQSPSEEFKNRATAEMRRMEDSKQFLVTCSQYQDISSKTDSKIVNEMVLETIYKGDVGLISCIAMIETVRSLKNECNKKSQMPRLGEIIFYVRAFGEMGILKDTTTAIASALVLGQYCKSAGTLSKGERETMLKLRRAYKDDPTQASRVEFVMPYFDPLCVIRGAGKTPRLRQPPARQT